MKKIKVMKVMNIQKTFKEKKLYVRPQITMIPMQAECTLLAASGDNTGGSNIGGHNGGNLDDLITDGD